MKDNLMRTPRKRKKKASSLALVGDSVLLGKILPAGLVTVDIPMIERSQPYRTK
jgi:hypothetical protein